MSIHAPTRPMPHRSRRTTTIARPRPFGARRHERRQLELLEERCLLTLATPVNYPIAAAPQDVALADFNNDGSADFVTVGSGWLSVAINNGDGTFQPAQSLASSLSSIAVGDLNADGKLDLAGSHSRTTCIAYGYDWYYGVRYCSSWLTQGFAEVMLGNGDGSFQPAQSHLLGDGNTTPSGAALGDFNGDGKLDVATGSGSGIAKVSVLIGNGDGTLQPAQHFAGGSNPTSLAVGDLNSDGKLDIATANGWAGDVSVLLGNGDGTLQPPQNTPLHMAAHSVVIGDVDADGKLDLAVGSSATTCTAEGYYGCYAFETNGYVNVLLGHGDGTFAPAKSSWANYAQPTDLAVGDFNADGNLDVVANESQRIDPTVLLGRGDGTFGTPHPFVSGYNPVAVAVDDLDGDGWDDVVAANQWSSNVSVLLNDGHWPPLDSPTLWINDVSMDEGHAGTTNASFTLTLSRASTSTITVQYATVDGTATAGADYTATSGTLTFDPGETTKTIAVPVHGDRRAEPWEYFRLALSHATNAILTDDSGTANIADDEPTAFVTNSPSVLEGNSGTRDAVFTLWLTAPSTEAVTVNFHTADYDPYLECWEYYDCYNPALGGTDYVVTTGSVTFAPGTTEQTVRVPLLGDREGELDEVFRLYLTGGEFAHASSAGALATILDDEPRVSIEGTSVTEGHSGTTTASFTVRLSAPSDVAVTVPYATIDGSAGAGADYLAKSDSVTFAPGETSKSITVSVVGDKFIEYDEYFSVNLSSPVANAWIATGWAHATIIDDDVPPSIQIADASVVEGHTGTKLMVFTVTLSAASDMDVCVNFATANGSARAADGDFVKTSGTLCFAAGETSKTISVVIKGDSRKEKDEYFYVKLNSAVNATIADDRATGTILDDDRR